jgi:hypothetical protein
VTPRPFGTAPFNDAAATRGDKNPYIQVGDAVVLSPTLLLDVRYGLSRVKTENLNGNKEGFTDYAPFGVPDNLLPYMFQPGSAPAVTPNGYGGGNGGGSNWTGLPAGTFGTARERQANHSVSGSVTKTRGKWVHKAGLVTATCCRTTTTPSRRRSGCRRRLRTRAATSTSVRPRAAAWRRS